MRLRNVIKTMASLLVWIAVSSFSYGASREMSSICFPLTDIPITNGSDVETKATVGSFEIRMEENTIVSIFDKSKGKEYPLKVGDHVDTIQRLGQRNIVLIKSGSASNDYLTVLNLDRHSTLWEVETFDSKWVGSKLETEPYCECGSETECHCYAGGVFELDKNCVPKELKEESLQKTKTVLGVAFETDAWVSKPKTLEARLIPAPTQGK